MSKHLYLPLCDNGMGLARTRWAVSMTKACLSVLRNYQVTLEYFSYPYPDGACNLMSNSFLESEADEMIVIDLDVVFEPSDLEKLLSHDLPLVYGLYPRREIGVVFPVVALDGSKNPFADKDGPDLVEVACCARGFMRVHRSVFESLIPFVEKVHNEQVQREQYIFWKSLPGGHSEDFGFCNLYRAHGGKIIVDRRITTRHEGSALYPIPGTY